MTKSPYLPKLREYFRAYPMAGYGMRFTLWAGSDEHEPYNSWGNGSAMRVGPVAYATDSFEAALAESKRSAEVTHNHAEGIRGAQAVAAAIFLARMGETKKAIKDMVEDVSSMTWGFGWTTFAPAIVSMNRASAPYLLR